MRSRCQLWELDLIRKVCFAPRLEPVRLSHLTGTETASAGALDTFLTSGSFTLCQRHGHMEKSTRSFRNRIVRLHGCDSSYQLIVFLSQIHCDMIEKISNSSRRDGARRLRRLHLPRKAIILSLQDWGPVHWRTDERRPSKFTDGTVPVLVLRTATASCPKLQDLPRKQFATSSCPCRTEAQSIGGRMKDDLLNSY
jgi:hypothetical protein